MAVLGLRLAFGLGSEKGGMGLAFGAHLLNALSTSKVSMSYLFCFPRYETKCAFKFLFRQLMMSQTKRFMLDQPPKQWLTGRKRGKDGNTEI